MTIKDSGTRREFGTGGHRDCAEGKGRMDLLPFRALIELSKVFEDGAKKYDDNNWRKGLPLSCYVDSASRHLAKWMIGWRDEPHLAQAAWNIMCLIETQAMIEEGLLPADLNDLPYNVLEIKENPNNIPPLRTSNKRAAKQPGLREDMLKEIVSNIEPVPPGEPDIRRPLNSGFVPKEIVDALNDIKEGKTQPIAVVVEGFDEVGQYKFQTGQADGRPLVEFAQLEDGY